MIDRSTLGSPIDREVYFADAELHSCRLHIIKSAGGNLFELVGQLACVFVDSLLLVGWNRSAKQRGEYTGKHRRGMAVGGADRKTLVWKVFLGSEAMSYFVTNRGRYADAVDRDENGRFAVQALHCHSASEDVLADADGLGLTIVKTAQPDRAFWRNVHFREADSVIARTRSRGERCMRDAEGNDQTKNRA